jgi:hypothetical protein
MVYIVLFIALPHERLSLKNENNVSISVYTKIAYHNLIN